MRQPAIIRNGANRPGNRNATPLEVDVHPAGAGEFIGNVVADAFALFKVFRMDQCRVNAHHCSGLFAAAMAAIPFRTKLSGNQPPVQVSKNRALCIQMMANLRDGFAVSTVTVQNNKMTETIIIELIANALHQGAKSLHAQRNRSGEADDIRCRTIVHSWRDHCVRHG